MSTFVTNFRRPQIINLKTFVSVLLLFCPNCSSSLWQFSVHAVHDLEISLTSAFFFYIEKVRFNIHYVTVKIPEKHVNWETHQKDSGSSLEWHSDLQPPSGAELSHGLLKSTISFTVWFKVSTSGCVRNRSLTLNCNVLQLLQKVATAENSHKSIICTHTWMKHRWTCDILYCTIPERQTPFFIILQFLPSLITLFQWFCIKVNCLEIYCFQARAQLIIQ